MLVCDHIDAVLTVNNFGTNTGHTGFLMILQEMGGAVKLRNEREVAGEPRADLTARGSRLRGVSVGGALIPRTIDELPLVAVLGLFAEGTTDIRDAAELRVKETDRIATLAGELAAFGATVEERPDGLRVQGARTLSEASCDSHGDHRLAMSLAVLGLAEPGVRIQGASCVSISYPSFWEHARVLGADIDPLERGEWR